MTQPSLVPKRSRFRRFLRRLAIWVGVVYLLIVVVYAAIQKKLIFPGHASQHQRSAQISPNIDGELVRLHARDGTELVGLLRAARDEQNHLLPDAANRPTILFFYGNAMSLADCVGLLRGWNLLGANTFGLEFPGYGMSGGEPGEPQFYAAADTAYEHLLTRKDIDPHQLIAAGLSLGTGVAVDLSARKPVAGLALFAPYTSMDDMARQVTPWLPTRLILRHHFRNIDKMAGLKIPILIARGEHDSLIPPIMSKRLADAAIHAQIELISVNSDHNDLFEQADKELASAMKRLIDQVHSKKS